MGRIGSFGGLEVYVIEGDCVRWTDWRIMRGMCSLDGLEDLVDFGGECG